MYFYIAAIILGLCFSAMSLGIYLSMKVYNIPDITTDGSYTFGAVIAALTLTQNLNFFVALPLSLIGGILCGCCTAFIHTKLKIDALLSGILVMTGLYSINLLLLGKSNLPLINTANIFNVPTFTQINENWYAAIVAIAFVVIITGCFWWFLKTDFGIAVRATGNNPQMVRAMGINPTTITIIGLGLANGLTALSGFLMVQYQRFADINMGIGVVITGLGSVLIGDALLRLFKVKSILIQLLVVILGSIVFQLIIAITLSLGLNPNLLKLITALLVLAVVAVFKFKPKAS